MKAFSEKCRLSQTALIFPLVQLALLLKATHFLHSFYLIGIFTFAFSIPVGVKHPEERKREDTIPWNYLFSS